MENDELGTEVSEEAEGQQAEGKEALAEPGLKALQQERAERKRLERELRALADTFEEERIQAVQQARTEGAQEWQQRYIRAEAKAALVNAGIQPARAGSSKVIGMLNLENLALNEQGEVDGLDAEIEALRADFPELFIKRAGTADMGERREAASPKSLGERIASKAKP